MKKKRIPLARSANTDPLKRPELAFFDKVIQILEDGKDVRNVDWNAKEVCYMESEIFSYLKY